MSHISKKPIKKEVADALVDQLLTFLTTLYTKREARVLVRELLTQTERIMLAKRLAVIVLIERGYSFAQIEQLLRVTPQTVARIWKEKRTGRYTKIARYARSKTSHFKREGMWDGLERVLRLGMPPRIGPGRRGALMRLGD